MKKKIKTDERINVLKQYFIGVFSLLLLFPLIIIYVLTMLYEDLRDARRK